MSAYQRNEGKTWKVELPPFGEAVEFKRRTNCKLEARWGTGVYLGVRGDTTERIVGTKQGTFVVQDLRRKPEEYRVDKGMINNLRGVPWDPNPEAGVGLELPAPITLKPENPESRRRYILRVDLAKYGFSENCRACEEIRKGRVRTGGTLHTSECRDRIEERMSADPEAVERLDRTHERQTEKLARALEDKQNTDEQHDIKARPGPRQVPPASEPQAISDAKVRKASVGDYVDPLHRQVLRRR